MGSALYKIHFSNYLCESPFQCYVDGMKIVQRTQDSLCWAYGVSLSSCLVCIPEDVSF